MKKTEKFIAAVTTIVLGVLLVVLRGDTIRIITSTLGIMIIVLGVFDLFGKEMKMALAKCAVGVLTLLFGFFVLKAILYVIAAAVVVWGVWCAYDLVKNSYPYTRPFLMVSAYAKPILTILLGVLLCFNQCGEATWVFILAGILTVVVGGLLFAEWICE